VNSFSSNDFRPCMTKDKFHSYIYKVVVQHTHNVSAMVPWRVSLKFYLRSTFSFRGTGRGFDKAPLQKHKRCGQLGWLRGRITPCLQKILK